MATTTTTMTSGPPSPTATTVTYSQGTKNMEVKGVSTAQSVESVEQETEFEYTVDFGFLPIPRRLRYDPAKPPHFGLLLKVSFAFASTFIVANLYYCQPLLIQLSLAFNVTYNEVSLIPTLVQAGYALGLLFISPLGDLVRRRQLIIFLGIISASLTIGLAVTSNLVVFEVLSFLVGVVSVTPQILVPLAADLASEKRRASALAFVLSGLLLGILMARVLAGVIAEFRSWRVVYYFSIGVQSLVVIGGYFLLPDYPSKNKDLSYFHILWTMVKFAFTEPILIQCCLINLASSACLSNFWVTLTFLLGGPPYHYSTLVIGLFGLVGMAGVASGPLLGRALDNVISWYGTLFSISMLLLAQSVQTGAGGISVAAVVISTFGLDVFTHILRVSLTTTVFGISMAARARLNAVSILSIFIGQVIGTSVGTEVFVKFGWRAGSALSMGLYGFQVLVLLIRGPHAKRYTWFGYEGGFEPRKSVVQKRAAAAAAADAEATGSADGTERKVINETEGSPSSPVGEVAVETDKSEIQVPADASELDSALNEKTSSS